MKIKFQGELSLAELQQAIVEQFHALDNEYLIQHAKFATLYFTPTNGAGKEVFCQDRAGRRIDELQCRGPYRSAADDYKPTK